MGKWSELKAAEKARIIQFAIKQGVSDIQTIRDTFNNIYAQGGKIHIDPSKKGTFTAAASKHGKSVQEFASQVLANKENYSSAMVKKAVFAHNSKKWHEGVDGMYLNTEEFIPDKNIQNKRLLLNEGTKYQRQMPGTVNIQNIRNSIDYSGADTQYIYDSARHNSYSAYRRNPNYRGMVLPKVSTPTVGIDVQSLGIPKITITPPTIVSSPPKKEYLKQNKAKWLPLFGEANGTNGFLVHYLENSPDAKDYYKIDYMSVPGTLNSGEGSAAVLDSIADMLSIDQVNSRLFDYKTANGGAHTYSPLKVYSTGGPLYPFSFGPLPVVRYAEGGKKTEGSVDPATIASRQAYAESTYRDSAGSRVGAKGIFQIMQPTLDDYNKANKDSVKLEDLTSTDTSLAVRNWYMGNLLGASFIDKPESTDSVRYAKALAAYNWGRGNVLKALNKAKAAGEDIYDGWGWLPYLEQEPRDYVNFILRGMNVNPSHKNEVMYQAAKTLNKSKDTKIRNSQK